MVGWISYVDMLCQQVDLGYRWRLFIKRTDRLLIIIPLTTSCSTQRAGLVVLLLLFYLVYYFILPLILLLRSMFVPTYS